MRSKKENIKIADEEKRKLHQFLFEVGGQIRQWWFLKLCIVSPTLCLINVVKYHVYISRTYITNPTGKQLSIPENRRGFPYWGARVWSCSKHMSCVASGPLKYSTAKSWRQKNKTKTPPMYPGAAAHTKFPLPPSSAVKKKKWQRLAVINPSFVLQKSEQPSVLWIWILHQKRRKGQEKARKSWIAPIIAELWLMFHGWSGRMLESCGFRLWDVLVEPEGLLLWWKGAVS